MAYKIPVDRVKQVFVMTFLTCVTGLAFIVTQQQIAPFLPIIWPDVNPSGITSRIYEPVPMSPLNATPEPEVVAPEHRNYTISWYNPPNYLRRRPDAITRRFHGCEYSNCILVGPREAPKSDAVMFDAVFVPKHVPRNKSSQVWIFFEHESPQLYSYISKNLALPFWSTAFNWTMTYDMYDTDIPVPYGKFVVRSDKVTKNYTEIWEQKKGEGLIITSHCSTASKRGKFITELQKYYPVDVFGSCGRKWDCGTRTLHNDCFRILNKYKFYLAFENAFCRNYFTEKAFENFKYDTVLIVRGGLEGDVERNFPKGSVISTSDFNTIKDLGKYLSHLSASRDDYIDILKTKDRYKTVSYAELYQGGLCELCKRLNFQDTYRNNVDMHAMLQVNKSCVAPVDLT